MKTLFILIISAALTYAINPIMLPMTGVEVEHTYSNGKEETITIEREVDPVCLDVGVTPEEIQAGDLASVNVDEECKKTFVTIKGVIQPLKLVDKVETLAEIEVLDFIEKYSSMEQQKYILVDTRSSDWFDLGTIPSAVNIPTSDLKIDEDFEEEYKRAYNLLGVKLLGGNKYDFKDAKTAIFFCNGSWCPQSSKSIKQLIKIGYPKEKLKWYRGGIASWAGVSLTLTKNIEAIK